MMRRIFQIWNNYEPIYKHVCTKLYNEVFGIIEVFRNAADEVICENKKMNLKSEDEITESDEERNSRKTIIDSLLDPKNNFSQGEISDEIITFIIAVSILNFN